MALLGLVTPDRYALACDQCGRFLAGLTAQADCQAILWSIAVDQGWTIGDEGAHRCAECAAPDHVAAPRSQPISVDLSAAGGAVVIRPAGRLAGEAAAQLRALLRRLGYRPLLVLDLQAVTALEPDVVAVLLRSHQFLRRTGGQLRLASLSAPSREALVALRLQAVFATFDSVSAALAEPAGFPSSDPTAP